MNSKSNSTTNLPKPPGAACASGLGRLGLIGLLMLAVAVAGPVGAATPGKQKALDEWRALTAATAEPPRVFVKGDRIQFYFQTATGVEAFSANWHRVRVPARDYKVNSAVLRWDQKLPRMPEGAHGWREATVVAGSQWRHLATDLIAELTPRKPLHGAYYQAFLADGVFFRDREGVSRFAALGAQPKDVLIERRCTAEETLDILASLVDEQLGRSQPGGDLFLLMAPNAGQVTHPLLLDRRLHRCASLTPAALYDNTERGLSLAVTTQGLRALSIESHGLALLRNPISSACRLADLGVATLVRCLQLPLPKPGQEAKPLAGRPGMDLAAWEKWLDHYTGTRCEQGALHLLIDGNRFFPRIRQAITEATNYIKVQVYIFDKDDVAVEMADRLKARSQEIPVKVMFDRMGSIAAGIVPPATPMRPDFVMPTSILSYLQADSCVQVRPTLNPWLSSDHSKVLVVDGSRAWVGGMNFGREYEHEWHDLMLEVEGPLVASLEDDFEREWGHAGTWGDLGYLATLLEGKRPAAATAGSEPSIPVRRLPTRTAWKPFDTAVMGAMEQARDYIYVENPYLFDKRVAALLVQARGRGVDVRVVLPRVNDLKGGGRSNLVVANYLLENGVRVYFFPGMTHVKALLVDGWSCLGSGNLNHLSLRVNHEQNLASSDPGFAATLKRDLFVEDFARSYELTQPVSVEWMDFLAGAILENF